MPFICGDLPICRSDEFLSFPESQGWQLEQSESLAQLAERAQAWLFFGLLAFIELSPDACVASDTSSMASLAIDTSILPDLPFIRRGSKYSRPSDLLDDDTLSWPRPVFPDNPMPGLTKALAKAHDVMKW